MAFQKVGRLHTKLHVTIHSWSCWKKEMPTAYWKVGRVVAKVLRSTRPLGCWEMRNMAQSSLELDFLCTK